MNQQEANRLVEGLRQAAATSNQVAELDGDEARGFGYVRDTLQRKVLLGSFCVELERGRKFYVSVASTPRADDQFQLFVFTRRGGVAQLVTSEVTPGGVVWHYQPTKQSGDNQRRKQAFVEAEGGDAMIFPMPSTDINVFGNAVLRALALREKADDAGGGEGDEVSPTALIADYYPTPADRQAAARALATTIQIAHALNPRSWCVTHPRKGVIRVNVGPIYVLDLAPGIVRRGIIGSSLGAETRGALGNRLVLNREDSPVWRDTGSVTATPAELSALPAEVEEAHRAYITRAGRANTQFARHHDPMIVETAHKRGPPVLEDHGWR